MLIFSFKRINWNLSLSIAVLPFCHASKNDKIIDYCTYSVNDWSDLDGVEGIVCSQCGAQLEERVPGGVGAEARHADYVLDQEVEPRYPDPMTNSDRERKTEAGIMKFLR